MTGPFPISADYASTSFDPVPEFQREDAKQKFECNLQKLCIGARIAFHILRDSKADLVGKLSTAPDEIGNAIVEELGDAVISAVTLLELIEPAEARVLVVLAHLRKQ